MAERIEHEGVVYEVDITPASPGPAWAWPEKPKYPEIDVHLSTGQDGNIFMILGAVTGAMRRAGVPGEEIDQFAAGLMDTGSYDEALQLIMRTVHVT